jgi:hypothetical protein
MCVLHISVDGPFQAGSPGLSTVPQALCASRSRAVSAAVEPFACPHAMVHDPAGAMRTSRGTDTRMDAHSKLSKVPIRPSIVTETSGRSSRCRKHHSGTFLPPSTGLGALCRGTRSARRRHGLVQAIAGGLDAPQTSTPLPGPYGLGCRPPRSRRVAAPSACVMYRMVQSCSKSRTEMVSTGRSAQCVMYQMVQLWSKSRRDAE